MRPSCGLLLYAPDDLCNAAEDAHRAGYGGVELHPHHLTALQDAAYRTRVLAALARHEVQVACVGVGTVRDQDALAQIMTRCELAAQLGAGTVFLLAPSRAGADWATCVEQMRTISAHAGERGLRVALHHHAGTLVGGLDEITRFVADVASPVFGICFDTAHYALYEDDLPGGLRALGPHIIYVHLKDLAGTRQDLMQGRQADTLESVRDITPAYTDLGSGGLDLAGAVTALAETGYSGWITVEMETQRRPALRDQLAANGSALQALLRSASTRPREKGATV